MKSSAKEDSSGTNRLKHFAEKLDFLFFTNQIPKKDYNIRLDMTECLLVVAIDVPVAIVSREPSRLLFLAQDLRICHEQNSIAFIRLTCHSLPVESLKIVNDAFVEQNNHQDSVEVKSLNMAESKITDKCQLSNCEN